MPIRDDETLPASDASSARGSSSAPPGDHPRAGLPTTIARFEVESLLGEGGMGRVLLARDPLLGRRIALKLLRQGAGDSAAARQRFLREGQAIAQLAHENVIVVHETGTHDGEVYLAMEYIRGETLATWQRARGWREILAMYARAGRGLIAAHDAGLVHRDFKPDNVLVGSDGRVRVTDFGLVAASGEGTELSRTADGHGDSSALALPLTGTGTTMGTPRYMAPEQHRGETADARGDQFSFCVAVYEALYGRPPFAGATYSQLVASVLDGQVPPAPSSTEVPAAVHSALVRGLAVDREARFPSMSELLAALEPPPAAAADTTPRHRWLVPVIGAVGLVAIVAVVFALRMRNDARAAADRADRLDRELVALKAPASTGPANPPAANQPTAGAEGMKLARESFDQAQAAYRARRWDEAVQGFQAAYAAYPTAQFLYNAGAALQMKGKEASDPAAYRRAVVFYRRYLAAAPAADDRARIETTIQTLERDATAITR